MLAQLPKRALLLGDRLYGVAAFVVHARAACARVGSHFLLRASRWTNPRVRQRLPDGTRLVAIALRARHNPTRILEWLETCARFASRGPQGAPDARAAAVDQSARPAHRARDRAGAVYAQRWEHELYFREVKRQVRKTDLLQSHTVETAAPTCRSAAACASAAEAQREIGRSEASARRVPRSAFEWWRISSDVLCRLTHVASR